ncbi:MAG: ABC transporter permease subunit, partial [Planctomycetota bacterium]|nr:ABC transporter permease subunit [Planctomycetota bacterium]
MIAIFQREFFGILRLRRAVVAIVAMALCSGLLVLARWPSEGLVDLSGSQARQVFRIFTYGMLAGVLLLAPAWPATSFVQERQRGTLALLFNTPLSKLSIYAGKLSGVLAFTGLLLVTSLPAAAACYAMGGVDLWQDLGSVALVLLVATLEYVAIGLLVSTFAGSTDAAVRTTYAVVFSLCFLTLGPHYFLQGQPGWMPFAAAWLRRVSPLPVLMHLVGQGSIGSQGLMESSSGLPEYLLASVAVTLAVMAATLLQLHSGIFDRSRSQGMITDEQSLGVRAARRVFFLVDPQRRSAGIPFWLNPVMVKEFRTRRFGRLHWILRLVAACAVVSLLTTLAATTGTVDWGVETIGGLLVIFQVLLMVLLTPSLSAGLISGERESGGWDLLRMTRLSGWQLAVGKLMSVAWTLLLVLLATLPGYIVMIAIKPVMWLQVSLVIVCLLLTTLVTLAVSAAVGSLFARTTTSTVSAYVVLLAMFFGPLLVWLGRDAPFGYEVVQAALAITPA